VGIADDTAFRPTEWDVHNRALPSHPCGERFHFIGRYVGMIANPSLARSARDVVLHAVSGQDFHLAVIHLRGQGNFQHALRSAQDLAKAGIELQELGGHVELNLRDTERI